MSWQGCILYLASRGTGGVLSRSVFDGVTGVGSFDCAFILQQALTQQQATPTPFSTACQVGQNQLQCRAISGRTQRETGMKVRPKVAQKEEEMSESSAAPQVYHPSPEIVAQAHIPDYEAVYARSQADLAAFWAECAEELEWYQKWDQVLDESEAPFFKWFVGAKTNITHNALDRHVQTWRRNKLAIIWEGEDGSVRTYTYGQLYREVCQFASVLKSMGVERGDRVTIYMGRVPELVIAMLACAKLGAPHSVVYGGFSVEALHARIEDAQSRVLITCDGAYLRGKIVELKKIADEALQRAPITTTVIAVERTGHGVPMMAGRDFWYHDLMALPIATPQCETEVMDAEDMLFLLYTSGTTGTPKGVVHTHGGYQVGISITLKWVFDIKEEDTWWCAADPGWITGHSYIVYAPLILGATSVIYEGAPTHPHPGRWWEIVEKWGVSILYTAPTAIRGLMRFGRAWPGRYDLSSLRLLGTVGEPINPAAWEWYHQAIGGGRCPIMDTWWQTETGNFMITPLPSMPLKPGSATRPFPGIVVDVVDEENVPCRQAKRATWSSSVPGPACCAPSTRTRIVTRSSTGALLVTCTSPAIPPKRTRMVISGSSAVLTT